MEKVKVEDAVGMVLAHDLTKIVPSSREGEGAFKGAAFKKGHIIRAEDIEELKNIGKNHLFVVPLTETRVHENEAARRIAAAVAAPGLVVAEPLEGKSNIKAAVHGLLKINRRALQELNCVADIAVVTLHDNSVVRPDQLIAAAKVIPLVLEEEGLAQAEAIARRQHPVISVKPFFPLKTGIIVTGTEVYNGRIQDRFGVKLQEKIRHYGGEFLDLQYAPDDPEFIGKLIAGMVAKGAEIILISGGMAVDADDVTPQAIREAATEIVSYGAPVLPGAMCMIAYREEIALMGVPACAMFNQTTILDLIYPRLLAKERLRKEDLVEFAHGGMCLQCEECRYPACSFGK